MAGTRLTGPGSGTCLYAVTVDCPDPLRLASFYQAFIGGTMYSNDDDFVALAVDGGVRLDFHRTANPRPPRWPDPSAPTRPHLDFAVDDIDQTTEHLVAIGAVTADVQPGEEDFRVFLDPVGHPFCIVTRTAASVSGWGLAPRIP